MLPHERLDEALNERRLRRRVDWNDVAAAIGIKARSLLDIRRGRNGPREKTARAMDDWLGWEPGSVARLWAGDDPIPLKQSASEIANEVDADLSEIGALLERAFEQQRGKPMTEKQRRVTIEWVGSLERTIEALDEEAG